MFSAGIFLKAVSLMKRLIIGVTGPTGSGKSTLRLCFEQRGCGVIDSDALAREIVMPGQPALADLAAAFGGDVICADGTLNRALLARRAFVSPAKAARLNSITHPRITELLTARIDELRHTFTHVAVEAPLLYEAGWDSRCDGVLAVVAPVRVRLNRIKFRDGLSDSDARARIGAQQADEFYSSRTPYVVVNDGEPSVFIKRGEIIIDKMLKELLADA